jgi:hypothetical protein
MRTILSFIFITAATAAPSVAQRVVGGTAPPPFPPAKGTVTLRRTLPAHYIPDTLKDLSARSAAVVEAYVQTTLPPQEIPAGSLFTDAVLLVTRVFKGPADLKTIVVGQPGGAIGEFKVKPVQYDLMQPGEHYILFLRNENRRNLAERPGMNRFAVTAEWGGYFRIESDGNISLARGTSPALRNSYTGKPASQMVNELLSLNP